MKLIFTQLKNIYIHIDILVCMSSLSMHNKDSKIVFYKKF